MKRSDPGAADEGMITIMVTGFAVILIILVAVVVAQSKVFLAQQALRAAADGAALAGADAVQERALYGGGVGDNLPLGQRQVEEAVNQYVVDSGINDPGRFDDLVVGPVSTDGQRITVVIGARVHFPFVGAFPGDLSDGVLVEVSSDARAPLR